MTLQHPGEAAGLPVDDVDADLRAALTTIPENAEGSEGMRGDHGATIDGDGSSRTDDPAEGGPAATEPHGSGSDRGDEAAASAIQSAAATDVRDAGELPSPKPPASWSISAKSAWDRLPADVRQAVAKRETEVDKGLAELRDYKDLKPFRDIAQSQGVFSPRHCRIISPRKTISGGIPSMPCAGWRNRSASSPTSSLPRWRRLPIKTAAAGQRVIRRPPPTRLSLLW
jgi:hypothetical protein